MNIFILDENPILCAKYHCDRHVTKMILEYAQLLCTAHYCIDNSRTVNNVELYKPTHSNHPCSLWTRECVANYLWLYELFIRLCYEYTWRYNKQHKTYLKLRIPLAQPPHMLPYTHLHTKFYQAMPSNCIIKNNPVKAYRKYYCKYKRHLAKWTNRHIPEWWI